MKNVFDAARWARVREDARRWWDGELERPLIQIRMAGRDPGRPEPAQRWPRFEDAYDPGVSPESIVDRWAYNLACTRFLGDAFPQVWPDFGAGALAAFLGARPEVGSSTVWFHPPDGIRAAADLRFRLDPGNAWFQRIRTLMRLGAERFDGLAQIGMTDLGGTMDVVATFRPGDRLLLDLYDCPAEVDRLVGEAHAAWWQAFDAFNAVIQPRQRGYTAWTPVFSETPCYMLQCDFSYMISPAMFDRFVKPELAATCRRLGRAFYHLDGPGALPHLDSLLSIPELAGIQWIPGAGQKGFTEWPEVYRKIHRAGKKIQLFSDIAGLDAVAEAIGDARGIVAIGSARPEDEQAVREGLARYGAPETG
jgi:5-methyltetrahydrofolate--homocysteine methyltransferase